MAETAAKRSCAAVHELHRCTAAQVPVQQRGLRLPGSAPTPVDLITHQCSLAMQDLTTAAAQLAAVLCTALHLPASSPHLSTSLSTSTLKPLLPSSPSGLLRAISLLIS